MMILPSSITRACLAVCLLAWLGAAVPAALVVHDVRVQGLETLAEEDVLAVLQTQPGQVLDIETVQADQRALLNFDIFSPDIRVFTEELPGGEEVTLIFTVEENPTVSAIEITGNMSESTERIESLIEQRVDERLLHRAEQRAEETVTEYYHRQGHTQARVRVNRVPLANGTVALNVVIAEGQVLPVDEVRIEGNEAFSNRRLRWHMQTRGSGITGTNHFDDDIFEQDLLELQRFYFDHGYLDATVRRGVFEQDEETGALTPTVIIAEGMRYRFNGIAVRGNTLFSDLEIISLFDDVSGDWFDTDPLRERLDEIREMYGDEGHINAVVEPRFDPDPAAGAVNLTLDIREAQRVMVGGIYLQRTVVAPDLEPPISSFVSRVAEGLSPPVTDDTVRRMIMLEEGDVYRRYEEVRTVERLRRLGIFENVALDRRPTADPTVEDVYLTVDQQSTGFLTVGAGLGDEAGLFGFVTLTENNLFGEADTIRASVGLGTRSLNFDVTYFNRHIGDSDRSLRVSAFDRELRRSEYDEERTGAFVEIGQPRSEHVDLFYRLRSEYVSFDPDDSGSLSSATRNAMDSYWLTLARVRLVEDRRDAVDWPTRGWLRGVSLEAGWADDWHIAIMGDLQYYRRLWRDLIFATNVEVGIIPRSRDEVAFGERFFLGGSQNLRGFAFRGASPVDSGNDDLHIGGSTKLLSQFELRFPIYERLRGVTFLDAGSLGDDPFTLDGLRASVGAGLRLTMPGFGYLAFDIAQAFASQHDDHLQTLHFTFRTDF